MTFKQQRGAMGQAKSKIDTNLQAKAGLGDNHQARAREGDHGLFEVGDAANDSSQSASIQAKMAKLKEEGRTFGMRSTGDEEQLNQQEQFEPINSQPEDGYYGVSKPKGAANGHLVGMHDIEDHQGDVGGSSLQS